MPSSYIDTLLGSALTRHNVNKPDMDGIDSVQNRAKFFTAFASFGWQLRNIPLSLQPTECEDLCKAGLIAPETLTLTELARIDLLRRFLALIPAEDRAHLAQDLFRRGDNAERETLLKALILLEEPKLFLDIALDACRSAIQTTVEAISCDNAYPALYFSADHFRGMVLKALHLGLPLARIHGLNERIDPELVRMAADYASELSAAGRPIPNDIILIKRA